MSLRGVVKKYPSFTKTATDGEFSFAGMSPLTV